MGKIDARTHEYLSDNKRFADIVNYYIYDGEQIIEPNQLHEMDATEIAFPYGDGENNSSEIIQKYRDLLKSACAMSDDKAAYLIIGMENQAEVQYAMPVKDMLYDAEQYAKQVNATAKRHREINVPGKKVNSGEFLSGFYKEDKLLPVITIVVFWSADQWDGPKSLHEMMATPDKNILRYVPDYKINLVSPYDIAEDDFIKFHTSIAEAFKYIKYSRDEDALQNALKSDNVYKQMDRETAELINDVTGSGLEFEEGKELINVCVATENMKKKAVRESAIETAKALLGLGKNTIEEIASVTKLPIDEIKKLAESRAQ